MEVWIYWIITIFGCFAGFSGTVAILGNVFPSSRAGDERIKKVEARGISITAFELILSILGAIIGACLGIGIAYILDIKLFA